MQSERQELMEIFREARALLARLENDFSWSSWIDTKAALEEIDTLLEDLDAGKPLSRTQLKVLFAPTGPMQEVRLSSGWGEAFLRLAERFDAAIASF